MFANFVFYSISGDGVAFQTEPETLETLAVEYT